jgi:hypothetical protein
MSRLHCNIKKIFRFKRNAMLLGILGSLVFGGGLAMAQEPTTDEAVQKDLQHAYAIAQSHFTDNPRDRLSLSDLQNYGFRPTEDVTIEIVNGQKSRLLITGEHEDSSRVFVVDQTGSVTLKEEKMRKRGSP